MELPVTIISWSTAALPLLILLVLMLACRWGAAEAGPVSWLIAVGMAWFYFGASAETIGFESVKGVWSAITVLYVVWASILIYEVSDEGGAFERLRHGIADVLPDPLVQVMAFGWAFASFLQGVTGFGVPIAVCAPLLVGIGVRPLYAVIIPLIGHAWNNTFGTLGVAWLGLKEVTAMDPLLAAQTALYAAAFIWILNALGGILVCWLYDRARGVWHGLPIIVVMSAIQGGLTLVLSQWNDVLNGFVASSVAFAALFVLARLPRYRAEKPRSSGIFTQEAREGRSHDSDQGTVPDPQKGAAIAAPRVLTLNQAFIPYYALVLITFAILLVSPLKNSLSAFAFGVDFPETITELGFVRDASSVSMTPFTHAGSFLLASAMIGYVAFRRIGVMKQGSLVRILGNTVDKSIPSTIAVIALIAMSNVMAGSGAIDILAHGAASATGPAYGFLAPIVGGLGAFMTTSNLASNLLFGTFQSSTADATGLLKPAILGAQTAGGAAGNMIAPGNVLLGTTTAGILGREGEVLRVTIPLFVIVTLLVGVVVFLVA